MRPHLRRLREGLAHGAATWRTSLQLQTVVITFLLTLVAVGSVGGFLSTQISTNLFQEKLAQALEDSRRVSNDFSTRLERSLETDRPGVQRLVNDIVSTLQAPAVEGGRKFMLYPTPGQEDAWVSGRSSAGFNSSLISADLHAQVSSGSGQHWQSASLTSTGRPVPAIVVGSQVRLPPGADYELYFIYDLTNQEDTLAAINSVLWSGGAGLVVLFSVIGWYVTQRLVHPLATAAAVSEKLAGGSLRERMPVSGEDEMGRLAKAFNKMADSLENKITALDQLSKIQQRFVSDVSHELRTPLTTMRMAADMLHDTRADLPPVQRRTTELLHAQVDRLQSLLAELLEISRFDAGAAVVELNDVDLGAVARSVAQDIAGITAQNHTRVDIRTAGPLTVEADVRRMDRILRNLMVNAVDHSDGKPVTVVVAGDGRSVSVAVCDRGIGMDPDHTRRVFDRFWRADSSRARTTGGTGLGLTISLEDAKLHRGELRAWGLPGLGATFLLTVPRHPDLTARPVLPLAGADEVLGAVESIQPGEDLRGSAASGAGGRHG